MKKNTESTFNISIRLLFIILGATILVVAPLYHISLPKDNPIVENHQIELDRKESQFENELANLKFDYSEERITARDYIIDSEILRREIAQFRVENAKELKEKVDSSRYLGWRTGRMFWMGFGIRLPLFVMAIIISILISNRQSDQKYRNSALFWLQASCYAMALYQLVWCFYSSQDYPLSTYWYALLGLTLLAGTFITYQFRYYVSVMGKLHRLQAEFMDFLVEMRNEHYEPLLRKVINRGDMYEQQLHVELDKGTKHLENRLNEKASELIN